MNEIITDIAEKGLSLEEAAEIWNSCGATEQAEIYRKMLAGSDRREKPNFLDYSRGTPVKFKQQRLTTRYAFARFLRRKGEKAIIEIQHPEGLTFTQEKLLDRIYERKAVGFDAFRLKLHEKDPDKPLSPIYITLRTAEHGGPLTDEDVKIIGGELYLIIKRKRILFDLVAGIPRAGESFAEVIARLLKRPLLKLGKKVEDDIRRIDSVVSGEYRPGQLVLLVDDLITQADTKKEAIEVCEKAGLIVIGITVLIDREQGGLEELRDAGYPVYAVYPLSTLLEYYVRTGRIDQAKRDEVMKYITENR
jgi:orotate phosphoribosyltransferase